MMFNDQHSETTTSPLFGSEAMRRRSIRRARRAVRTPYRSRIV